MACIRENTKCRDAHNFHGVHADVPTDAALVLHYDSINLDGWKQKFRNYKNTNGASLCVNKTIPFRFYCESIEAVDTDSANRTWAKYKRYRKGHHYPIFINPKFPAPAIVLVGNGPTQGAIGDVIDAFPVVVRFNQCVLDGYTEQVGCRIMW